jgi:hypothetical protein
MRRAFKLIDMEGAPGIACGLLVGISETFSPLVAIEVAR